MGFPSYDYRYSATIFFWIRTNRNIHQQKMVLSFGTMKDLEFFSDRESYPSFFLATPPGSATSFWSLADYGGTTAEEKQENAKAAAIAAAEAHWIVVEETYEIQAFYNP